MTEPAAARTTPLLERDDDLRRIAAVLEAARAGAGALAVVEGPAGIGKTELLLAARRQAVAAGMRVATARGSELERELAFGVVRQLFERTVADAGPAARTELLSGVAALAAPLFGPVPGLDLARLQPQAQERTFEVLHGLYWLCANVAAACPLLLAVDDAHWADLPSLRYLAYLAGRRDGLPLAIVVATRPAETAAEEELLVRLVTDPRAVVLAPAPLSAAAVAALVREELGGGAPDEVVEACHRATGGTPFLVRELLRELRAEGAEPDARTAHRIREVGPRTIGRAVLARVRRLGEDAVAIARIAAVLGTDAQPSRIARLARVGPEVATVALDALAGAGVVRLGPPVEFVHPIVRSAVYREVAAGERGRLHGDAAALLAEEGVADDRIASHLLATQPAGDPQRVDLLVRTAEGALRAGAPASAVTLLERALAEPPRGVARARVLHRLGVVETQIARPAAAAGHLEEARRLTGDADGRVRIGRDLVTAVAMGGDYDAAARVIGRTLDDLGSQDGDVALALQAQLLQVATLEPALRATIGDRLGPADREISDGSAGAHEYAAAVIADLTLRQLGTAAEVRELAERACAAGFVRDPGTGWATWNNVVHPSICADGFELAERMIAAAFDELAQRPSVIGAARAYAARAMLHLRRGQVREAVADARTSVEAGGEGRSYIVNLAVSALVDALVERGEFDAARAALEEAGLAEAIPDTFLHNWVLAARGRLRLAAGDARGAAADFEDLLGRNDRRAQPNPGIVASRSGLALALRAQDDAARAVELARAELELARRWGAARAVGIALRTLGLCQGGRAGVTHLEESVAVLAGSGARLEHARSLVELGAALRRSGRRADARDHLHAGMELAHRCGASRLAEHARAELVAAGARPRRIVRSGLDALTPSELRVARLAAQGLTNREVAQALFITPRTVETHLTQVFRKLDIGSRAALADRLVADLAS